jgi:hypothetical protein
MCARKTGGLILPVAFFIGASLKCRRATCNLNPMGDLKKKSPDDAAQLKAKGLARWENEGGAPASRDRSSAEKANYASRDPTQIAKSIAKVGTTKHSKRR